MTNVAIVGAGTAGFLHALAYRAHRARIVAVYDVDAGRADRLAELVGARAVRSLDAVDDSAADVVSLASPPGAHIAQAERFASGGRTVVVEKPVVVTVGEVARARALVRCVPVVQWREGKGLLAVRRAIAEGWLGTAPSVALDLTLSRDAAYFATRSSPVSWGAGALLSVGIHALDAACFALGGRVERAASLRSPGPSLETSAGVVCAVGASVVTLRVTFEGGPDRVRLAFAGGGVTAIVEGGEADPTARRVRWLTRNAAIRWDLRALERATPGAVGPPLLVPYLRRVLDAVRGEDARIALPTIDDVAATHLALIDPPAC